MLLVSSAEVYGIVAPDQLPITEDAPLRPVTPYAASKVAAEFLGLQAYLGSRPPGGPRAGRSTTSGPAQAGAFVVADLARRIVEAERGGSERCAVGNLTARRDFTDVRDVVRAYRLLVERGEPGEVYNVCSGSDVGHRRARPPPARAGGRRPRRCETDPDLVRPVDVPVLRGDPTRIRRPPAGSPRSRSTTPCRAVLDRWRASARSRRAEATFVRLAA